MQYLCVTFVKVLFYLTNLLPLRLANLIATGIVKFVVFLVPSYRRIAYRNLSVAFPEKSQEWRADIFEKSCHAFGRMAIDTIRIQKLGPAWIREHIKCQSLPHFHEIKKRNPGLGCIFATGHLGSFDLMGHAWFFLGSRMAFVVRNFKHLSLDKFWNGIRGAHGNQVISRKGALKEVTKSIKAGVDTAILFDQNVKRKYAVFVDWFGVPAATTALPAIVALRAGAPLMVTSICYTGEDQYEIIGVECVIDDIRNNKSFTSEEKIRLITARISGIYEKMIRAHPEEWLWMHKRWKTRPDGEAETFYK